MSDDRINRAERIRNMREGNRGTDDDQRDDESAATDDTDESAATDDQPGGDASLPTDRDEATADTTSATQSGSTDVPTAETPSVDSSDATDGVASRTASTGDAEAQSDTDAASEAQAAAQRAAASAAEVVGADAGTAESAPAAESDTADAPEVPAGATGAGTVPGDITGVELPDRDLLEAAMQNSTIETTEGGARAAMGEESTQAEEIVRVLEFSLGGEYYCLDIEYVEEIVKRDTVTRVPNTPAFVDGVVDLRGQITTILEPKAMMDIDGEGEQNLIIVFDPDQFEDQGAIGWVVDEVRQVVPVTESEVNHPPVDAEYINGVVDREEYDQFVIWVEPEDALAQATATEEE